MDGSIHQYIMFGMLFIYNIVLHHRKIINTNTFYAIWFLILIITVQVDIRKQNIATNLFTQEIFGKMVEQTLILRRIENKR